MRTRTKLRKAHLWMCLLLILGLTAPALAQHEPTPEIALSIHRDFGYGMGLDLQGTFSLRASGPETLQRVEFWMDEERIAQVTQAPFRWQSNTDDFEPGIHHFVAVGFTHDGQELRSQEVTSNFLSAEEAREATSAIVVPLVGGILGLMLIAFLLTAVFARPRKTPLPPGAPRNYGLRGGAICPKCARPFGLHIFAVNLAVGRLDRCPHCGKWSLVRRASQEQLAQAQAAEVAGTEPSVDILSDGERLRRDIENSRYQDNVFER